MKDIEIFNLVNDALYKLKDDKDLFIRNLHEQTVAFRLAHYMQNLLNTKNEYGIDKKAVVDVEYNKNGSDSKGVYEVCGHGLCSDISCYIKENQESVNFKTNTNKDKSMKPDILVHIRDSEKNQIIFDNSHKNFLAIEIKKKSAPKKEKIEDCAKLTYLTCQDAQYQFKLGLHIVFDGPKYEITVFENGIKEEQTILGSIPSNE